MYTKIIGTSHRSNKIMTTFDKGLLLYEKLKKLVNMERQKN